jgi:serine/threonine protein kinase
VLKTFRSHRGEEKWRREVDNLIDIRTALNSYDGAVKLYGSFTHGSTFNVILEQANGGTLEQYFNTVRPPRRPEDIFNFWKSLISLLEVLAVLCNLEFYDKTKFCA